MTTTYTLNNDLVLTEVELSFLASLPDNLPDTKLTKKQIEGVNRIYYDHVSNKYYKGWGKELDKLEQEEKWPSGPKVKSHEARRMIINTIVGMNTKPILNAEEAAEAFKAALDGMRESYQILLAKGYKKSVTE